MYDAAKLHALVKNAITNPPPGMTPEQVGDLFACLLTAALGCMPCMIEEFTRCMFGAPPPPAAGYDPGDRTRC